MAPARLFVSSVVTLCALVLAFVHSRPTLAQTSINIEEVGRITLPPVPPESPPGLASDLWTASDRAAATPYSFTYVGRYVDVPARVEVYDTTNPAAPVFRCQTIEAAGSEVEDVVVEGRFLYVASQDDVADIDGVQVRDLVNLAAPSCTGPASYIAGIPSAHDLFFYTHSSGMRILFVATLRPNVSRGIHVVDVTNPGVPVPIGFIPYPSPPTAYCDPAVPPSFPPIPPPPGPSPCGPHDIYAQRVGAQDLLVIAGLLT